MQKAKWELRYPERATLEDTQMLQKTRARKGYERGEVVWYESIRNNFGTCFTLKFPVPKNYPYKALKGYVVSPHIEPDISYHMFDDGSICQAEARTASSRTSVLAVRNRCVAWTTFYELSVRLARQTGTFKWMGPGS